MVGHRLFAASSSAGSKPRFSTTADSGTIVEPLLASPPRRHVERREPGPLPGEPGFAFGVRPWKSSKKLHEKSEQRKVERDAEIVSPQADQGKVSLDKAASPYTEQVESAEQHVDYAAPAELFLAKRSGSPRARLGYRRFPSAAEAIRFAIEELPPSRLLGAYMQVGDLRYDANSIRLLYRRDDYPLNRSEKPRRSLP